jgi:HAD superfamily hydrolase (TIGR01662 family)
VIDLRSDTVTRPTPGMRAAIAAAVVGDEQMQEDPTVNELQERVADLLGPFDVVRYCVHGHDDGCACRKPAPGMVKSACTELGVSAEHCVVVGVIGSDVEAARAAGATAVLVPNAVTRPTEIDAADHVAENLTVAVDRLLTGAW